MSVTTIDPKIFLEKITLDECVTWINKEKENQFLCTIYTLKQLKLEKEIYIIRSKCYVRFAPYHKIKKMAKFCKFESI